MPWWGWITLPLLFLVVGMLLWVVADFLKGGAK
jgi:hypothetical protein